MDVARLIETLQQLPQDAQVVADVDDWELVVVGAHFDGAAVVLEYIEQ